MQTLNGEISVVDGNQLELIFYAEPPTIKLT